ncbi:MAG: helix-hairpin-helix domain-containing protein [Planctomycetes bacterium]|jgi:ERCC4-type nuclease|nr:helix-hairpin-helix domain-containing protein [Planctomycetota bacterium]
MRQNEPSPVRMDFREEPSGVGRVLEDVYGHPVASLPLRAGDYLVKGRFRVERKTAEDFLASLADGRLFEQACALARGPEAPFLVLEGGSPFELGRAFHPHAVAGAIVELAAGFGVRILLSHDPEGTAFVIDALDRAGELEPSPPLRRGPRPKRPRRRAVYFLSGLPGVGPKRAAALLDRFGSLEAVLRAEAGDLASVPRVGPAIAAGIRELLGRDFRPGS